MSVASLVVGVAGATTDSATLLAAGVAGLVGGAISMALGEYVSVSSQRDSQRALIEKERGELADNPATELEEGLSPATARLVAEELTAHDPLTAHLEAELGITENQVVSPWAAAGASALAFALGALLPLLAILLPPPEIRVPVAFAVVLLALALTGFLSARIGGNPALRPTIRVVLGGAIALVVTFAIGTLLGTSGVA